MDHIGDRRSWHHFRLIHPGGLPGMKETASLNILSGLLLEDRQMCKRL